MLVHQHQLVELLLELFKRIDQTQFHLFNNFSIIQMLTQQYLNS